MAHNGGYHLPIVIGLYAAIVVRRPWVPVIDEGDIMADKHLIFDGDPFTNKGVTGDFAEFSDGSVFLDLYKGPDLCLLPDAAAIEINKGMDGNILPQRDIGSNSA